MLVTYSSKSDHCVDNSFSSMSMHTTPSAYTAAVAQLPHISVTTSCGQTESDRKTFDVTERCRCRKGSRRPQLDSAVPCPHTPVASAATHSPLRGPTWTSHGFADSASQTQCCAASHLDASEGQTPSLTSATHCPFSVWQGLATSEHLHLLPSASRRSSQCSCSSSYPK